MKKILLSLILVLSGLTIMAQSGTDLKLNLEKNKAYRFKSSSEQTISQTVNGMQQTTNVKSNSVVSIKMVDATAEFIIAEVRFDTLITNTNAMGKIVNINSASEGNMKSEEMADVMTCIMNRLSKNAIYVKMDLAGQVLEIVNAKMLTGVIMKDTGSITGQMAPVIKTQIKNSISETALKTMVEMFTRNLPGKQVATGDKWDVSLSVSSGGMSFDIITTYILNGVKGNAAAIEAESNIKVPENADPMDYGGFKISYDDLKGMGKTSMVLDTRTGLFLVSTSKTHIAGNLSLNVQGNNMMVPMDIDGESTIVALL